jgi:hypothetical protein
VWSTGLEKLCSACNSRTFGGHGRRAVDFISADDMITPKDIVEAALLPFSMTSRACPTNIVVRNTVPYTQ